jgi:hypothetical protein
VANGTGSRLGEFSGGAYENRSVLDNIQPSGIGHAAKDRARMYKGGKLRSVNGASTDTDSKRQWLDTPYRTFG